MAVCTRCGNTLIAVRREQHVTEILRDARTGHVLMPWEKVKLSVEETKRRVAAGEILIETHPTTTEVAHLGHHCPECDAGRELEGKRKAMMDAGRRPDRRTGGD